jgi:hypothetical protein
MVPTQVLLTVVLSAFALLGGAFYALVHVLGARIDDLGGQIGSRMDSLDGRMESLDGRLGSRMDALTEQVSACGQA